MVRLVYELHLLVSVVLLEKGRNQQVGQIHFLGHVAHESDGAMIAFGECYRIQDALLNRIDAIVIDAFLECGGCEREGEIEEAKDKGTPGNCHFYNQEIIIIT